MALTSKLSRLVAGVQRQVDLSANTLVVQDIQIGATLLTQASLDALLAGSDGKVKVSATDTTTNYLSTALVPGSALISTILNPGADETLSLDVKIESTLPTLKITGSNELAVNLDPSGVLANLALGIDARVDNVTIENSANQLTLKNLGVTDAHISASAAIAYAKLALTDKIVNADVNSAAGIAYSKLNLFEGIVDGDVNPSAAIAYTKLSIADGDLSIAKTSGLQTALDGKVDENAAITGATKTKISYDAKGLVTAGADAAIADITGLQTALDDKVAKAGSSMDSAASITFSGGGEVLGLPSTPSVAGAAASKAYVDAVALGLAPKKAVRVATTVAGTLATSFADASVIDGITLATGDRILIKDQAAPAENGIYIVAASGSPTRATDMDSVSPIDEINGAWVPVQLGTANAGRIFVQYGVVVTVDTSAITFEFYNPLAALVGGDMITNSGSTFSVDLAAVSGLESSVPGDAAGQLRVKLEAVTPSLKIDGSNQLAAKLDAAGAIASGASGLAAQVDASTIEISANALRVKDAGITAAKLATDVTLHAIYKNDVDGSGATITTDATDGDVIIAGTEKLSVTADLGLSVSRVIDIAANVDATTGVITQGGQLLLYTKGSGGSRSVFLGTTYNTVVTGTSNIGIGGSSFQSLTTGSNNVAIGRGTLGILTTGGSNVAIGRNALLFSTIGSTNTGCGFSAGSSNSIGTGNTYLGESTGASQSGADSNCTFVGRLSATDVLAAYNSSTALGYQATITASNQMVLGSAAVTDHKIRGVSYAFPTSQGAASTFLQNNGSGTLSWAAAAASGIATATKTAAYTVVLTDGLILADATSAAFTVTLPTAASAVGKRFDIKKIDAGLNIVTVQANGAELIDGVNTQTTAVQYQSFSVVSDGTQWWIV